MGYGIQKLQACWYRFTIVWIFTKISNITFFDQVEVASLMAAHAAEQAAANIKAAADQAVQEGSIAAAEVDKIVRTEVSFQLD